MKMMRLGSSEGDCRFDGRTVVVGVKLDPHSKELLTWALVKVAQTGDRVIALHVLNDKELHDPDGKSSLLSLVKAFDSVLAVYEGFCNLKQVDLKLKICRGSSIRKVLVREAKSFSATKVIVGIARNNRGIGSSSLIAKYIAKKLPLDCSVLAVNNGKVVFQREPKTAKGSSGINTDDPRLSTSTCLLGAIQRTLSKNSKVLSITNLDHHREGKKAENNAVNRDDQCKSTVSKDGSLDFGGNSAHNYSPKQQCSICAPIPVFPEVGLPASDNRECTMETASDDSMALVPVQTLEAASSSISLLIRELPELRPGWPLLRRKILPDQQASERSSGKQISVVQWAMRLPSRHSASAVHPDHKTKSDDDASCYHRSDLNGESGAIVPVGEDGCPPSDPITEDGLKNLPKELECLHEKYASTCRLFCYEELRLATSDFSSEKLIGKGGNSRVYKGRLPDSRELAVKILKPSEDVLKEFILEIEIITTLHHKNIISLFGFCFEDNNLLLVYDFLSKGSLEENLHDKKDEVLCWGARYKVAIGVGEALDYLHSGTDQPVIHRDVKSSNILLSDDFEPQLSDFGFAKWALTSSSHITCSDVAGTFGYLAPEYFMYGKVNEKVDVYAFGVVLLELLSGRKPISNKYPKGQESLVMWAKPILRDGKILQLLDPSLGDKYDNNQMEKLVLAASLCIRRAPQFRPRMDIIVKLLQGDEDAAKWARLQVNASEEFDERDDESHPVSDIQSHLNLALLDVEDDSLSISSTDQSVDYLTVHKSFEDYLQERWSRSSSFD